MSLYKRALRTFDTASLTGSPQNIGAVVDFPVFGGSIYNTSTVGVLISDGTSEDDIEIPAGGTFSFAGVPNPNGGAVKAFFPANVQLQVTQVTAAAAGKLILDLVG